MPLLSESIVAVGDDATVDLVLGETDVSPSSSPLSDAVVSDDFRALSAFPAGWSNPYASTIDLADFTFDGSGAVHPGAKVAGGDLYYHRAIPEGVDFWDMTCVFHLYFPTPSPSPWWNAQELTIIHDPAWAYDAERYSGLPQARNDTFTRPPRLSVYAYGSGINYGSDNIFAKTNELDFTPFEDVELVIVTWADALGYHTVLTNGAGEIFRIDRPALTIPTSYTTLNKLVWQTSHNFPEQVVGESPITFKGFYVLSTPTDEVKAAAIAAYLIGA